MKTQVMRIVAAASFLLVLSAVPAFAQLSTPMNANIPFDFQMNGKTLSAGAYQVEAPQSPKGVIIVRQADGRTAALAVTQNVMTNNAATASKLVFRKYGNQYFLAQAYVQGRTIGVELPQSKAERNLVKELGARHLANNKVVPEIVTVTVGQ